ncbi:MAG: MFS transporter [Bacteroidetes bacterium]|nr:MFS transporter [Bacteroidota bacterium]
MTADPAHPISRRTARIATATFFFISGITYASWASRIPTIQQQLHLDEAQLGAVLFALPAGLMCMLPLTGILLRRFSSRHTMVVGAILFTAMLALLGFATQVWQIVVVLFCFGASRNLFNISLNAQSLGVQALYDRYIIASFHGIWSIAGSAGAAIGTLAVSQDIHTSWHFVLVCIPLLLLMFFSYPRTLHQLPAPHERKEKFSFDRGLLIWGLTCFAAMSCEGTMIDWSAIYFKTAVNASGKAATWGFVIYMTAMTIGRFTGDRLANHFGIKKMLQYSGLLIGSGLLIASLLPYGISAGIGFIMTGFGVSCVVPLVFTMAGKSKTMSSGPAIAAVSTIGYIGFLLVPPIVGFIAKASSLRWSFAFIAVFGILITAFVSRTDELPPVKNAALIDDF